MLTEKKAPYLYSQHEPFQLQELYESVRHCLAMQQGAAADPTVSPSETYSKLVARLLRYRHTRQACKVVAMVMGKMWDASVGLKCGEVGKIGVSAHRV